jgi:hypothetical protein
VVSPTKAVAGARSCVALAGLAATCLWGSAAVGESPRPAGSLDAVAVARQIDESVQHRLSAANAAPAAQADDAEFLRRAYLDIAGIIPPADRVVSFLADTSPDKRTRLIDDLLASPNYGRHMADVWLDLLVGQRDLLAKNLPLEPLSDWLARGFNANTPWDRQVTDLLTSTGTQEQNGATTFFLAHRSPDRLNDTVCRVLLGIQLQCAQCHNHPYTGWKRTEYWGMAAFFEKVDDGGGKKLAKGPTPNVVEANSVQKKRLPDSALETPPKILEGEAPRLNSREPYRPVLAKWLTSAENPYFARAMVNRVWAQFFGRGLVNPVDDLAGNSPPSHPELFDALSRQFIRGGFDVKDLVRGICNSRAYQRSSTPPDGASGTTVPYAVMTIRPLTPEQLYDSLATVLGSSNPKADARGKGKGKGPAANSRAGFVDFFHPGDGADPTEYPAGIPQVLRLMNSDWTAKTAAFAGRAVKTGRPPAQNVESLYVAILSRRPTEAETRRFEEYVRAGGRNTAKAYGDIVWAILNSSEFGLNH